MCTIKLFKYKPNKSIKIARITKKIIIKQANQVGHFGIFLSSEISIKNDSTNGASLKLNRTKGFWWSIYIHLFKYKKKNPSLNAWIMFLKKKKKMLGSLLNFASDKQLPHVAA